MADKCWRVSECGVMSVVVASAQIEQVVDNGIAYIPNVLEMEGLWDHLYPYVHEMEGLWDLLYPYVHPEAHLLPVHHCRA